MKKAGWWILLLVVAVFSLLLIFRKKPAPGTKEFEKTVEGKITENIAKINTESEIRTAVARSTDEKVKKDIEAVKALPTSRERRERLAQLLAGN